MFDFLNDALAPMSLEEMCFTLLVPYDERLNTYNVHICTKVYVYDSLNTC